MNNTRKIFSMVLAMILALSLLVAGCGGAEKKPEAPKKA